uniref:Aminopeptidase n=1 Tax=Arcella intermedia TaxID=1963864 RepID=A0A6B2KZR7_9EUKA
MIAVPDFNALAMENWGLIIYRENALLCDYNSSLATKYLVSFVVAHEIAHQWFGNLVTMEWWKELWLNEGFANFVATQALDHYFPEWNMWEQFATKYIFEGMKIDSMRNSHPIEVPISKARAVVEIFDMISYNKGASVIRMLENYLGDNFRIGLSNYLSKFKYQNTVTEDLWDSLSNVCGKNIREIMGPWSTFQGFPVVHVCESEKEGLYEIAQKRFLKYGEPTPQEDEPLWYINLAYISDTTRMVQYIDITHKHNLVEIPHSSGWLKLNAGQSGFYRVQYCEKSFGKLLGAIHELPMIDQLGIQNDAVSLAISGNLPVEWALQVLLDLRASPEPILWIDIDQNVQQLSQLFSGTPAETYFSRFLCHLYENINQKVGWEPKPGELELVKMLRPKVLYTLGNHGDNQILNEAKKRFEEYLVDLSSQSMDILPTIFKLVMRNGGDVEYDTLLSIYNTTKIPEKRLAALISLSYSRRPDIIKRALEFSLSSWVSPQDAYYFFQGSTSTMEGQTIAWKFMKDNWEKIIEKIGQNFLLGRTVTLGTTLLKTEDMAQEVENFFLTRRTPAFERSLNQALETIRGADNFISKNLKSVFGWLRLTFPDPLDPLRTYAAAEGLRYREETGRD